MNDQIEPLNEDEIINLCGTIHGWMSRDELRFLYGLAHRLPTAGVWVEVGVWKGRSLLAVAMGATAGSRVVGVDTFFGTADSKVHGEARIPHWIQQHAELATGLANVLRRADNVVTRLHVADSLAAAAEYEDESVDIVFLDADHEMRAVERDIRAWWPKIKPTGILAGHDYGGDHVGVEQAVRRALTWWLRGPGSLWFVPKSWAHIKP